MENYNEAPLAYDIKLIGPKGIVKDRKGEDIQM